MLGVLMPALLTGLATTVGALPFLLVPAVSRRFYDTLLGFGAGLMLAAATLGLLTTALSGVREGATVDLPQLALILGGFLVGVLLLWTMDRVIPHEHAGGHGEHVHEDHVHLEGPAAERDCPPAGIHAVAEHAVAVAARDFPVAARDFPVAARDFPVAAQAVDAQAVAAPADTDPNARRQGLLVVGVMSLHRLPEGLAIGAAYAGGGSALGLTLAIAIAVQNAVEGGVMAAPLRRGGLSAGKLLALVTATGMSIPVAAVAGFYLSSRVPGALPPTLALAAGALLYLTCNEIIPESHSHGNEVRATFGVVGGFVLIMLMQVLFGDRHG